MIHTIEPGQVVNRDASTFKRFDLRSGKFLSPPRVDPPAPAHLPALGSGWITYAAYVESSSNVINFMTTTWTVPPAPTKSDAQLIYLFNGLQDSPVTHILQPVLQWGVSPDGGGAKWAVASWFVDSSNNAFKTPLVDVNPGDTLTGVMRMTSNSAGKFNYTCEFSGIASTKLTVNNTNQLVMPVETLECYSITECRDYPNALSTAMRAISVNTSKAALATSFGATNAITDCGQQRTSSPTRPDRARSTFSTRPNSRFPPRAPSRAQTGSETRSTSSRSAPRAASTVRSGTRTAG